MDKKRKEIIENNEVSSLYTFSLGGVSQKVLIEGKTKDLPIVLVLHGGPGSPIPFSVGCRGLFPEFTDKFIMVYWDQLGSGINDYNLSDKFDINSFVNMTIDLIKEVKAIFPTNPLILFGMSWGSVLTLKVVKQVPNLIDAVVTWGQVIKNLFFNEEVLWTLKKSNLPKKKYKKVEEILAKGPAEEGLQFLTGCIRKYTNGYQNREGESSPVGNIIKGLMTSPDYSLKNFKSIMINGTAKSKLLWKELLVMDLSGELATVDKPYVILQGDTDIVTNTSILQQVVDKANNPKISYKVVEKSGHIPGVEGMNAIWNSLSEVAYAQGNGRIYSE